MEDQNHFPCLFPSATEHSCAGTQQCGSPAALACRRTKRGTKVLPYRKEKLPQSFTSRQNHLQGWGGQEEPPSSAWGHAIVLYGSDSLAETVMQNNTASWSKEGCRVCKTPEIFQKDGERIGRDPAHGGHQYGSISLLAMKMPKNTVVYALEEVKDQVPQWKENAKQKELLMQPVQSSQPNLWSKTA